MSSSAEPKVAQLAFCTADLPATVRLYSEAFGFASAGGRTIWGPRLAAIQGLGADAATLLWWLVGRQDLCQLELFTHTQPPQRPLPADWRPSDHGWVRWGLAIPDFDDALARLGALGVPPLTEPATVDGLRRVCFRDPYTGIPVEVMEEGAALPGGIRPRFYDLVPAVVYAALSVSDLARAHRFLTTTVGLIEEPAETLHDADAEALWGLAGARYERFVARGGDVRIEVTQYIDPAGRPKPDDHRLSDQGFMNAAVGFRRRDASDALLERLAAAGHGPGAGLPETPAGGTYVSDEEGTSLEVISAPREFDAAFGFAPERIFRTPSLWPQPHAGPAR